MAYSILHRSRHVRSCLTVACLVSACTMSSYAPSTMCRALRVCVLRGGSGVVVIGTEGGSSFSGHDHGQ
jgi:hypothetical protein